MTLPLKPVDQLTIADFEQYPVWEYALDLEEKGYDETWVRPFTELPITSLGNRVLGTQVRLNNGEQRCAVLDNITFTRPDKTEQFIGITIIDGDRRFHLARYVDTDYKDHGPAQLAEFLGLPLDQVFPITYDIASLAVGHPDVIKGRINAEPSRKLNRDEIMKMVLSEGD